MDGADHGKRDLDEWNVFPRCHPARTLDKRRIHHVGDTYARRPRLVLAAATATLPSVCEKDKTMARSLDLRIEGTHRSRFQRG